MKTNWLSDAAIDRLRAIEDRPEFLPAGAVAQEGGERYELLEEIGRGGMGLVFRGRDRELDRDVAIKVTAWSTEADAERLRAEARTLARLEHPGIVPVHDVGRLADGRVFTVMMLVRGERLDARAAALPLADRLRLFDRICDTVAFAHARGLIHRDLKPANIMVGEHGQVLVLDWGLARAERDAGAESGPEVSEVVGAAREPPVIRHGFSRAGSGTEGYMAPEQMAGPCDARSDVFALGAILRDLAEGAGAGARSLRPLKSIVERAMQPDPAARYQSPTDLAADVRRFVDGAAVDAHRESVLERAARLAYAYRAPIGLVLAYLVMRALLLLWS
jgi:serine/threonine protein kinase